MTRRNRFLILLAVLFLTAGCRKMPADGGAVPKAGEKPAASVEHHEEPLHDSEQASGDGPCETQAEQPHHPETTEPENHDNDETIHHGEGEHNGQGENEDHDDHHGETGAPEEHEYEDPEHPRCPELSYALNLEVPPYDGQPWIMIHDGIPFFDTDTLTAEAYECYYDLDSLGRCTLADAVVGKELMPTEKRGSISSVHPTGWHSSIYPNDLVDGGSLYNRCHLIAFGLCGETANPYNLVTGTRYFNTKGVNDFENLVIDYIRETGNHVRYRVTPIFTGENLICDGQIIEAWSIEDGGEDICFCIYAYNVQPGIVIDYLTGDNRLADGTLPEETAPEKEKAPAPEKEPDPGILEEDFEADFVLNIKKLKIHTPDCSGAQTMSEKNRSDYHGSYNSLIQDGYAPCPDCCPWICR